ncbi:hypothetical protein PHMEG_00033640, partial [Phytophthora megakarya]
MALISVLTQVADGVRDRRQAHGRRDQEGRREKPRHPAIPDNIRRLTPLNRQGKEPCLLNLAGLPCSGGSRDRCGNHRRVERVENSARHIRNFPSKLVRCRRTPQGVAAQMHANAQARCILLKEVRSATLDKCMRKFGIKPRATDYPASRTGASGTEFLLNKPLRRAKSELARTSGSTLSSFVEMIRGQT